MSSLCVDNQHPTYMDDLENSGPYMDTPMGKAEYFGFVEAKYGTDTFAPPDTPPGEDQNTIPGPPPHYVIGGTLTFDQLGIASGSTDVFLAMHYTARCANDWITVKHEGEPGGGPGVPEPGPLAIMMTGLIGLGFSRKFVAKKS